MYKGNRIQSEVPFRQKVILIIFGILLSLIFLEIGLRIGGFIFLTLQEHRNLVSIKKKGTFRIMCLGESTTAIGGENSYPSQLEEILNQHSMGIQFSVINKGVIGINTTFILVNLESNLNTYGPDMVITMMGINDEIKYLACKDINSAFKIIRNFRTFKLARLLCLHLVTKLKEIGLCKTEELPRSNPLSLGEEGVSDSSQANSDPDEEIYKRILESDSGNESLYISSGLFYKNRGDFLKAEEVFKKAIELNPRNDDAYIQLGLCYSGQKKLTEAKESLRKARELNDRNVNAYLLLGMFYGCEGEYLEAEELLKKAIELAPRDTKTYIELGWVYVKQGKYVQAEDIFKKAIELNSEELRVYGGLATVYNQIGKNKYANKYEKKVKELISKYYNPITTNNYKRLKEILDKKGIKLVCVQYPMYSIEPLKKIFEDQNGVIFVDNEKIFKEAVKKTSYEKYFVDIFGGDFGHCTPKGDRLLAENIAEVILKEYFRR